MTHFFVLNFVESVHDSLIWSGPVPGRNPLCSGEEEDKEEDKYRKRKINIGR